MRVLFITSSSINGGAQKHIREMFKSLTKNKHEVYLIAPNGWLTDELKEYGDRVVKLNPSLTNNTKLIKIIDEIKPDITNTFILSGGVYGTLAWKKKKYGKLFVTVNNPVIYPGIPWIGKILYPRMYRWMSRFASAFLVKSDKVRDEVSAVIRNKKPVLSIKNGVDFCVFDKNKEYPYIRKELGILKEEIVITNVAALDVRKGQEYLIKAASRLREHYPVSVLLVGEGEDEERLRKLVKEETAEAFVHFMGRRSDINCILANSDIFVLSSLHEGLPNALMEAMAMGLPCIATDVGGVRQLIDDEDKGIVIRAGNADDIIRSVQGIISDKNRMTFIGDNAYKKIAKDYSQETAAKELEEIYQLYG